VAFLSPKRLRSQTEERLPVLSNRTQRKELIKRDMALRDRIESLDENALVLCLSA
jgi:hypothetical protein